MIVISCGLPGSGKSFLAKKLAKRFKAKLLSSDILRKKMIKNPAYRRKEKLKVYDKLIEEAVKEAERKDVVIDATFYLASLRKKAMKAAEKAKVPLFIVEKTASEKDVKARMKKRPNMKNEKSDADFAVYRKIKKIFEEIKETHFSIEYADGESFEKLVNDFHLAEIKHWLSRKEAYKEKAGKVEIKETHISVVFLNGTNVYKLKKPINPGFLDYSTLAKRKALCREEIRINSLLSKELYLGVAEIKKHNGRITVGGKGKTIEYAVKMKQLPEKEIMTKLLAKGKVNEKIIRNIAKQMTEFHKKVGGKDALNYGKPKDIWNAFSNAFLVKNKIGRDATVIEKKARAFLRKNGKLFMKRVRKKKIKDCHGDLHSGNIFIHNKRAYIFDAIEFNKAISSCDVAAEIAFMAMDLEFNNKKKLADVFVEEYCRLTNDYEIYKLIGFYKCYRASIRMMANAMQGSQTGLKTAKKYAKKAVEYTKIF